MDVFLTLDYELFLGERTGSVGRCLVETSDRLCDIAEQAGARFTFFVDATYLLRLRELSGSDSHAADDFGRVASHLHSLAGRGHDLQLHIHPQWQYSDYSDGHWTLDSTHYKIHDIPSEKAAALFRDGCSLIEEIGGRRPVAFRAGGFSAQPTSLLRRLLIPNGISIDCSVYPGNVYHSPQQDYDYATAPTNTVYRFSSDICVPDADGDLTELPLSVCKVSPLFYWGLVARRLARLKSHRRIGDGLSVKTTGESIRSRLTTRTDGFATIDESKISYLPKAFRRALADGADAFCVIGHPKLATPYSLSRLPGVLRGMSDRGAVFRTVSELNDQP